MNLSRISSSFINHRSQQSGAALVVGLIFLVILTLLGLTAMQTGILEERMAGNSRDRNIAFQAAEAALRDGEHDVLGVQPNGSVITTTRPTGRIQGMQAATSACSTGLCCNPSASGLTCVEPATPVYTQLKPNVSPGVVYGTYTGATQIVYTVGSNVQALPAQPQYLIEPFMGGTGDKYFRISARGYGVNTSTTVTLQEIYKE